MKQPVKTPFFDRTFPRKLVKNLYHKTFREFIYQRFISTSKNIRASTTSLKTRPRPNFHFSFCTYQRASIYLSPWKDMFNARTKNRSLRLRSRFCNSKLQTAASKDGRAWSDTGQIEGRRGETRISECIDDGRKGVREWDAKIYQGSRGERERRRKS